jgi:hypothetical protein
MILTDFAGFRARNIDLEGRLAEMRPTGATARLSFQLFAARLKAGPATRRGEEFVRFL